jgi:hypothetical protein
MCCAELSFAAVTSSNVIASKISCNCHSHNRPSKVKLNNKNLHFNFIKKLHLKALFFLCKLKLNTCLKTTIALHIKIPEICCKRIKASDLILRSSSLANSGTVQNTGAQATS